MEAKVILTLHENEVNNRMKNFKLKNADELKGALKQELSVLVKDFPKVWTNLDVIVEEDKPLIFKKKFTLDDMVTKSYCEPVHQAVEEFVNKKIAEEISKEMKYKHEDENIMFVAYSKYDTLLAENKALQELNRSKNCTIWEYEKIIKELREENSKVKEDNSKLAGEVLELQDELRLANDANEGIKKKCANLIKEMKDNRDTFEAMKKEVEKEKERNDVLCHRFRDGDTHILSDLYLASSCLLPILKDGKRYSRTEVEKIVHETINARDKQFTEALEEYFGWVRKNID